ncbi:MAG: DinB family protein [Actinomycetota bacterium]
MVIQPLPGFAAGWAESLWELEDTRRRTLEALGSLDEGIIDLIPSGQDNSIGALLHHIALIETDWLYADIIGTDYPSWVAEKFPDDDRDEAGQLVRPTMTLKEHLATLGWVRRELLTVLATQPVEDFDRPRVSVSGTVSPRWVLHHLRQHEAEHRGQIQAILNSLK